MIQNLNVERFLVIEKKIEKMQFKRAFKRDHNQTETDLK